MKKIAVVTATRAEYGLLRWTIEALRTEPCFDVQLVVGGTHLSPAFGETWRQIEADGVRATVLKRRKRRVTLVRLEVLERPGADTDEELLAETDEAVEKTEEDDA